MDDSMSQNDLVSSHSVVYLGWVEQELAGDFHELLIRLIGHEDLRGVLTTGRSALAEAHESTHFDIGVFRLVQFLARK